MEGDSHHNYNSFFTKMEVEIPENGNYSPNLEVRVFNQFSFPLGMGMLGAASINL